MNIRRITYAAAGLLATCGVALAATQTLTLGTSTGPGGVITLFGSTSGSATIQTPAAAGTGTVFELPGNNGTNGFVLSTDGSGVTSWIAAGGTGTVTSVVCGGGLTGGTITTTGTCAVAPVTFAVGTTHSFAAPTDVWECSATCTVTPPTPAAGYQFCVRNTAGTSGVITLAAVTSVLYEKTDNSAYGTAATAATSGGAVGDKICIIGKDSTHYDVMSFNGTWSVP
jgi:hypothetical protein